MITIIALFDIQSHDSPVAIGAPMHGETGLQIGQTPKHEREPRQQSSENEEKPLLRGGDGIIRAGGQRCSLAKVQLGNPG
jgi:hypothetical protein